MDGTTLLISTKSFPHWLPGNCNPDNKRIQTQSFHICKQQANNSWKATRRISGSLFVLKHKDLKSVFNNVTYSLRFNSLRYKHPIYPGKPWQREPLLQSWERWGVTVVYPICFLKSRFYLLYLRQIAFSPDRCYVYVKSSGDADLNKASLASLLAMVQGHFAGPHTWAKNLRMYVEGSRECGARSDPWSF